MRRHILLATASIWTLAAPAHADDVGKVFSLGQVSASAAAPDGPEAGGSTVTQSDMQLFDRNTLDDALKLVPGVTTSVTGGRNETDIRIRGFGGTSSSSAQIPLYWDGIPIYLPADDRIDFARFTTSDISEIQVTKSYTSVIAGPGAIGGSINLVSREVTRPVEGDARLTTSFDQDGALNGIVSDLFVGSRQGDWFVQGAGTENYKNHFRLSDDYQPGTLENGGNSNLSYHQDYKLNFKVGYAPSATDEYSLNVIDQQGTKDQPLPDTKLAASSAKCGTQNAVHCWSWPDWDNQSVFWISKTGLDDLGSYVKTRAYYERFYNVLDIWDTPTETTMNTTSAQVSTYDDRAAGGSVEVSKMLLGGMDNLKGALHFRWDEHNDQSQYRISNNGPWFTSPWSHDDENTYSAAIENTFHPWQQVDITPGVSYDYRQMLSAGDWASSTTAPTFGSAVTYPVSDKHAVNPEILVAYHYDATGTVHASLSDRTRFPSLFEMYSTRFGGGTSNPYLQPERALTWEGGVADTLGHTHLGANLFYARLSDAIESVSAYFPALKNTYTQSQNVGDEKHQGFELEASSLIAPGLEVGANYAYLIRKITNQSALTLEGAQAFPTDSPKHSAFAYANWQPITGLSVVPSVEIGGKRYLQGAINQGYYYRGGDSALANLKVGYKILANLEVEAGVNNIFDTNYQVEDGYHGEGRNFFTTVHVSF